MRTTRSATRKAQLTDLTCPDRFATMFEPGLLRTEKKSVYTQDGLQDVLKSVRLELAKHRTDHIELFGCLFTHRTLESLSGDIEYFLSCY
jgi:hypothetical protein